jgi:hypothetical protein
MVEGCRLKSSGLKVDPVSSCCVHGSEPSIKSLEFFNWLSNY